MELLRDYVAERLARADAILAETKQARDRMVPTDRALARTLRDRLDGLLKDLRGAEPADSESGRSRRGF